MSRPACLEGYYVHEIHAEIAAYRLERDGIKPELLAYLRGIGKAYTGPLRRKNRDAPGRGS